MPCIMEGEEAILPLFYVFCREKKDSCGFVTKLLYRNTLHQGVLCCERKTSALAGVEVSRGSWEGVGFVIKLTKFNSEAKKKGEFVLNAEIIETIEETPDTVVTLVNGKKLIVDEPMDEIVRRVMKYRRALKQF